MEKGFVNGEVATHHVRSDLESDFTRRIRVRVSMRFYVFELKKSGTGVVRQLRMETARAGFGVGAWY